MPASREAGSGGPLDGIEAASGGPLDGIRVLDLSSVVMGPLATQILGDLGADVISVENRDGDINRIMGPGPYPGLSGVSLNLLRNKRNIALDIAHPDGRAALLRVAAGCDVFVTNLRPGSVARLRLRYPDVAAVRPDVIYCQAHGFPAHWAALLRAAGHDELVGGPQAVQARAVAGPGLRLRHAQPGARHENHRAMAGVLRGRWDSGRRGHRAGRPDRRAARCGTSRRRPLQGDPAAGPVLRDPGRGAAPGAAGRAAHP